ncbi:hypothetical protein GCM10020000_61710 [Streptomyces olivoverticillatus]
MRGQVQNLFQHADGPQRLRPLWPPRTLLPVTEAGHTHFDAALRQPVLHPVQGESAGRQRGAQRQVEGARAQRLGQLGLGGGRAAVFHPLAPL